MLLVFPSFSLCSFLFQAAFEGLMPAAVRAAWRAAHAARLLAEQAAAAEEPRAQN